MPTQQDKWILLHEAVEIISRNSGRPVNPDYVRLRLKNHKISEQGHGHAGRRNRYDREVVEQVVVTKHDFPTRAKEE
jgi:hypothetical protein